MSGREIFPFEAQVLRSADVDEQRESRSAIAEAQEKAQAIRARAEAEADEIIAAAHARADDMDRELREIADEQLLRFVDTNAIDEAARAVQRTLSEAHRIAADFDAVTPWMTEFVKAALFRITGEMPREELWTAVIQQALSDVRERWDLKLRCHPTRVNLFTGIIKNSKDLSETISLVQPDRDLDVDDCLLVSANGVLDISISTQIVTLLLAIEHEYDGATET